MRDSGWKYATSLGTRQIQISDYESELFDCNTSLNLVVSNSVFYQ